jgi:hypothetical protein
MPARSRALVLDDRLLIEELLVGLRTSRAELYTTTYWYYRACRAAIFGAGGHLSGPFEDLDAPEQEQAVLSLLELRDDISLPDPRPTVPAMVGIARRHPRLNLMNLEAVAAGQLLGAKLWLSRETSTGILPGVLDQEEVAWQMITIE